MQIICSTGSNGKDNQHLYASKMMLELFVWVVKISILEGLLMGYFHQCKAYFQREKETVSNEKEMELVWKVWKIVSSIRIV